MIPTLYLHLLTPERLGHHFVQARVLGELLVWSLHPELIQPVICYAQRCKQDPIELLNHGVLPLGVRDGKLLPGGKGLNANADVIVRFAIRPCTRGQSRCSCELQIQISLQ